MTTTATNPQSEAGGRTHGLTIHPPQLRLILEVTRALAVTTNLDLLLVKIAKTSTEMLECERASIFLHDPKTDEVWTKVALEAKYIRIPCCTGIAGWAFSNTQLLHVSKPYEDTRFNPEPDRRTGFVTRNLLTFPM